jgi:hypothetical protein
MRKLFTTGALVAFGTLLLAGCVDDRPGRWGDHPRRHDRAERHGDRWRDRTRSQGDRPTSHDRGDQHNRDASDRGDRPE